ncbi:hypothetical protein F5X68DRAFT_264302 [Plectosphaerella plurivora]|uniref:C2H2-type domain-containing protein n=1 Tax=Plectosphaerella plurivora TaxID=936078 RepID=A0A9P8V567_9PEZI|nr:hypothetical protein F5X68DRAFT_264302 [Plectosphaerella plurivora]
MAVIAPFIDRTLDTLEAAYDGGGGNQPGRASTKRGTGLVSSSASNSGPLMAQKRGNSNQSHESDGENDGDQRTGGRTIKRTKTTERNKKFACPYYKHDPIKHAHTRTCSGPGWDEVHRVKEHVYRRHELPQVKCNRCYEYFGDERDLEDHQRMDVPCIVRERGAMDPGQGFDEHQKMLLKSGKKSKLTEIERWKEVYSILFRIPIDSPEMPSPFYDASDLTRAETTTVITSNDFKAYMSYCRREAPKAVRQALESEVDREYGIIEDRMRHSMVRVVETSFINLWTTFQSIKPPDEVSTMPDPNSSAAARDTNGSRSPSPNVVLPHDVSSLVQNVFSEDLNLGLDLNFEGLYPEDSFQSSLCHQDFEVDSGYRTYSDGSNNSDPSELLVNPAYDSRRGLRY